MMIWWLLTVGIVLDHAHLASPIATAWANRDYRRAMLERPWKFILLPIGIIVAVVLFSLDSQRHDLAFEVLVGSYLLWNSYHFGMQNFGIAALYGYRGLGFTLCCITMLAMSVTPLMHPSYEVAIIILLLFSFTHWLGDIALSTAVSGYPRLFLGSVLAFGFVGFLFKSVGLGPEGWVGLTYSVPILFGTRISLGFVHFLYSRWIWRRDTPFALALA